MSSRFGGQIGEIIAIPHFEPCKLAEEPPAAKFIEFIPKTNVPVPRYFTSDQAALYLGLDPKSMKDWRYRRLGPPYQKIGHRIRYCQVDLDAYLKDRKIAA